MNHKSDHKPQRTQAALMTSIDSVAKAKEALNASASGEMQSAYASLVQQPRMRQLAENLQQVLQGRGAVAYSKMSNGEKMILNDFIKKPVPWYWHLLALTTRKRAEQKH